MLRLRRLIVEIIGARNLMPKDGTGSASAFCDLDYDGIRTRTKTKPKDLSPTWGERNDFPYGDGQGTVEINVYSERTEGTLRHGFLGRVQIKVPDVVKQGQEARQWLRLEKRKLFSRVKGELGVKVWYEDPKPPPPAAPDPRRAPKKDPKAPPPVAPDPRRAPKKDPKAPPPAAPDPRRAPKKDPKAPPPAAPNPMRVPKKDPKPPPAAATKLEWFYFRYEAKMVQVRKLVKL